MPRLGYNKSRAGCLRCKERRVKCDENRPCAACCRHGLRCSLLSAPPADADSSAGRPTARKSKSSKAPSRPQQSPKGPSQSRVRPIAPAVTPMSVPSGSLRDTSSEAATPTSGHEDFPYFSKLVGPPRQSPYPWTADLELMHHYSTTAFLSLPRGVELQHIWQTEMPRLALTHGFLMHQVLAISACHLAHLHPSSRSHYSLLASQHQTDAVKELQAVLPRIDEENCHAIFSTSSLLGIATFGVLSYPGEPDGDHPNIDDLLDVFLLVRGMSQILDSYQDTILRGPLGTVLELGTHESTTPLLASVTDRLKKLRTTESDNSTTQKLCQDAASSLIEWIEHAGASSAVPELRVAMVWPIRLPGEYMNLLRIRDPDALTVLGYYCVILNSAGESNWFMKGWGESILKDASRSGCRGGLGILNASDDFGLGILRREEEGP